MVNMRASRVMRSAGVVAGVAVAAHDLDGGVGGEDARVVTAREAVLEFFMEEAENDLPNISASTGGDYSSPDAADDSDGREIGDGVVGGLGVTPGRAGGAMMPLRSGLETGTLTSEERDPLPSMIR